MRRLRKTPDFCAVDYEPEQIDVTKMVEYDTARSRHTA